jgi:hypothetical protein
VGFMEAGMWGGLARGFQGELHGLTYFPTEAFISAIHISTMGQKCIRPIVGFFRLFRGFLYVSNSATLSHSLLQKFDVASTGEKERMRNLKLNIIQKFLLMCSGLLMWLLMFS